MDFSDVKRSEITYKEVFAKDLHSMAFVVEIRSILCLMKVVGLLYSHKARQPCIYTYNHTNSMAMAMNSSSRVTSMK